MHDAVIIGSGFSGLCLGIKLKEAGINDFIILEKSDEVGGTWRENTYPGAECDIPSALYSYSFEPYPYWEYKWSHQPQILDYLKYCAAKYKIYDHIHFQKTFTDAEWDDSKNQWNLYTAEGDNYLSNKFILAVGQLHIPKVPRIKGLESFLGAMWHSAQWNHDVSLKGKTVSVVGNAASAIQFIPHIAKTARRVNIFQRSANWMLPKQDRLYRSWEKALVRKFPILLRIYRLRIWLLGGALFFLMKRGSGLLRKVYQWKAKRYIARKIDDPHLRSALIPHYPMGARRILFSDDYYDALNQDHVHVVTESITHLSEEAVHTTKVGRYDSDVVVFATGFKSNPFFTHLNIIGKDGMLLRDAWAESPKSYYGIFVPHFPNMFVMYGPNTNLGHNSIIIMSEAQSKYITQCIVRMKDLGRKTVEVKSGVVEEYYDEIQTRLQNMIWAEVDDSWYKSTDGNIPNNWPGRTLEYVWRIRKVCERDFQFT